jgi:hypothetical protein
VGKVGTTAGEFRPGMMHAISQRTVEKRKEKEKDY